MPKFQREVEIDAPVEKVWEVMTNPDLWPQWLPGVETVSNATVGAGGKFQWTKEGKTGTGKVVHFEPQKLLEILTQIGDDQDSHVFRLRSSGGFLGLKADECKVEYILDTLQGGGILINFIAGGNPIDLMKVNKALNLLRRVVESQ